MRQPLVAGNWKMNGSGASIDTLMAGIKQGLAEVKTAVVAVCPPFVYIPRVVELAKGTRIGVGSQDISDQESGAFTGEVAGPMLKDVGCSYAIVGHSERRAIYAEDDAFTARKFAAARKHGLIPILCVGELLEQREQGITEQVVGRQLDAVIELEGIAALSQAVIAYEPVWAIGTGRNATPAQAGEAHAHIRSRIRQWFGGNAADQCHIIYGGSVKPDNVRELASLPDVDGALVGGASLEVRGFFEIVSRSRPSAAV